MRRAGRQTDAGTLVPAGMQQPGDPWVGPDDGQVVGAVGPEAGVAAQERHACEDREQPDRLRGEAPDDGERHLAAEPHALPARTDEHSARTGALDDGTALQT